MMLDARPLDLGSGKDLLLPSVQEFLDTHAFSFSTCVHARAIRTAAAKSGRRARECLAAARAGFRNRIGLLRLVAAGFPGRRAPACDAAVLLSS